MRRSRQFTGLKKMVSLLGADYDIMSRTGNKVQAQFYSSAIIIIVIFIVSCFSIGYAVHLLFHSWIIVIILSTFLSSLFVCIYIFLLHTFAKKQLGKDVTKKTFGSSLLNASNFLRTGFIVFIAFIIAKPLEVCLFQSSLSADVQHYKETVKAQHYQVVDNLFQSEIDHAEKRRLRIEQLQSNSESTNDEQAVLARKIDSLDLIRQSLIIVTEQAINHADFFIYQVKTVMIKYRLSYLVCAIIIILFLLPGYLIYTLSEDDEYYDLKKRIETAIVLRDYHQLLKTYSARFDAPYGVQVEMYTVYEDPPFNTKRKSTPLYQSQSAFFERFTATNGFQ
jgi:hypothetical protein